MMRGRGSGILLHITSLPSSYGIGDLGSGAYRFADFLSESGQSYWQILPLNPTDVAYGNSPYSSFSAFGGNPLLVSPDLLVDDGFLPQEILGSAPVFSDERVEYHAAMSYKAEILAAAFAHSRDRLATDVAFSAFCTEHARWLDDHSLFVALKDHFGGAVWADWPEDIKYRHTNALHEWRERMSERILREKFHQFLFYRQWAKLKRYCNARNVQIIGDIPIYVNYDSVDVWANPGMFKLDGDRRPVFVAGVPPDYFSATGQLWGNPVYDWDALRKTRYAWWIKRFEHNLEVFNIFRIDHFRGFVAYWEVDASAENAIGGTWIEAPVNDFFRTLFRHFPSLPVIAEDLGLITPDVRETLSVLGLPGMKLLLFAFGENVHENPYAPHNFVRNCVAYTGTHDNNTVKGWFRQEAGPEDRQRLFAYLGREVGEDGLHWEMIRLLMMSVADMVLFPMQDVLGLAEDSRMNYPSVAAGNWTWRVTQGVLNNSLSEKLYNISHIYNRI